MSDMLDDSEYIHSSSLVLKQSLRESVTPFQVIKHTQRPLTFAYRAERLHLQGLCFIPRLNHILTIDTSAIRLWSFRKQAKAVHWTETQNIKGLKILRIAYIESIDCVVTFCKKAVDGHVSYVLKLWHPERLNVLAQVYAVYRKCTIIHCDSNTKNSLKATLSSSKLVKYTFSADYGRFIYIGGLFKSLYFH